MSPWQRLRTKLRDCVAEAAWRGGLTVPRRRGRGALSVATFHRVLPETERLAYP